ncbi:MAG: tyrosine--tRNA ligase [Thermoplasmata archaeon]
MDTIDKLSKLKSNVQEIITEEELYSLLSKDHPKMYIGFEPSGAIHLGSLIIIKKLKEFHEAGFEVNILLADWHAMLNDKLNGDLEKIKEAGILLKNVYEKMGVNANFLWASNIVSDVHYWELVLKVAKASTLARIRRSMTIMGRKEEEGDADLSKLIYPCMQVADIFYLDVDVAYAGEDQRKAHMLAREVADKYHWKKVIALHTPILSNLKGNMRMDSFEGKMSKSNPENAILFTDTKQEIENKLKKAYCPEKIIEGNPVIDIVKYIIFPWESQLEIVRPIKFGGSAVYSTYNRLKEDYEKGAIHPMDLKNSVAIALERIMELSE